jgi:hypothetical protein
MRGDCKACGAQLPADATVCPSCGAAIPAKRKLLPLAAFMLIVILVIQSYLNKEEGVPEAVPSAPVGTAEQ